MAGAVFTTRIISGSNHSFSIIRADPLEAHEWGECGEFLVGTYETYVNLRDLYREISHTKIGNIKV